MSEVLSFDLNATTYNTDGTDPLYVQDPLPAGWQAFNPLVSLESVRDVVGDAVVDYWCRTCASVWTPIIVSVADIVDSGPPTYPCFSTACLSLNNGDLCFIGLAWMRSAGCTDSLAARESWSATIAKKPRGKRCQSLRYLLRMTNSGPGRTAISKTQSVLRVILTTLT